MERTRDVTRVVVLDDHTLYSEALSMLLSRQPDIHLVGAVRDPEEVVVLLDGDDADVVLLDADAPHVDAIAATRRIRRSSPHTKVVILASVDDPEVMADALAAGACGYVPKTRAVDELMDAVRRAAAGELVMRERDLAPVLEQLRSARPRSPAELALGRLTRRETQILRALAAGEGTTQVAAVLGISALTVQSHVKNILAKLGVHSKIEAVTLAWRHGLAPTSRSA